LLFQKEQYVTDFLAVFIFIIASVFFNLSLAGIGEGAACEAMERSGTAERA
jgi:hypothetical protein